MPTLRYPCRKSPWCEAGLCGEDGDGDDLQGSLDDDTGETGFAESLVEVVADFLVFDDSFAEVFAAVPNGIPATGDAEPVAYWINFLSHDLIFLVFGWFAVDEDGDVVGALEDSVCSSLWCGAEPLEDPGGVYIYGFDVEVGLVDVFSFVFLLPVVDSREEELLEPSGGLLFGELEDGESKVDFLAADEVGDELHLAWGSWDVFQGCEVLCFLRFLDGVRHISFSFAHFLLMKRVLVAVSAYLRLPLCPRNVRVSENSPSLCPTMFSVM